MQPIRRDTRNFQLGLVVLGALAGVSAAIYLAIDPDWGKWFPDSVIARTPIEGRRAAIALFVAVAIVVITTLVMIYLETIRWKVQRPHRILGYISAMLILVLFVYLTLAALVWVHREGEINGFWAGSLIQGTTSALAALAAACVAVFAVLYTAEQERIRDFVTRNWENNQSLFNLITRINLLFEGIQRIYFSSGLKPFGVRIVVDFDPGALLISNSLGFSPMTLATQSLFDTPLGGVVRDSTQVFQMNESLESAIRQLRRYLEELENSYLLTQDQVDVLVADAQFLVFIAEDSFFGTMRILERHYGLELVERPATPSPWDLRREGRACGLLAWFAVLYAMREELYPSAGSDSAFQPKEANTGKRSDLMEVGRLEECLQRVRAKWSESSRTDTSAVTYLGQNERLVSSLEGLWLRFASARQIRLAYIEDLGQFQSQPSKKSKIDLAALRTMHGLHESLIRQSISGHDRVVLNPLDGIVITAERFVEDIS